VLLLLLYIVCRLPDVALLHSCVRCLRQLQQGLLLAAPNGWQLLLLLLAAALVPFGCRLTRNLQQQTAQFVAAAATNYQPYPCVMCCSTCLL
jgi:hypothetical protein